jgi:hypothetical protein
MQTGILKTFIIILSSVILVFGAWKTIEACAGGDETDTREYSVFTPEIIHQPDKAPFFVSYHSYYGYESFGIPETNPTLTDRNTTEWMAYFNQRIAREDLEWLLYSSNIRQLDLISKNFSGKKVNIDTLNQPFLNRLKSEKGINEIIDYLILAKKAEPYFNITAESSWEPVAYDTTSITDLLPDFKQRFSKTKNKFLKDRYGFQITRALSVSANDAAGYVACTDFFDKQFNPGKESASMYYRSLGYKARALYKLHDYSNANYLYSIIYDHDPCGRYQAFQSFHPQEEEDWNASLTLAKSTREKEVLWHMLGIYTDPLKAMKEIYSLNPTSDLLPLLLVRAVNLAEENSLSNPVNYGQFYYDDYPGGDKNEYYEFPGKLDSSKQKSLIWFINNVIAEKKVTNPAVWQLSSAYLFILNGALRPADEMITRLSIDPKDSLANGQAEILKGILTVNKLTSIDAGQERLVQNHIQKILSFRQPELRSGNAIRYMLSLLSLLYEKKGDRLKQELTYPRAKTFYNSSVNVQKMIDFMSSKSLNPLETYLANNYPLKLAQLYEIKGVALMYEYDFKAAIREFNKAQGAGKQELYGNPFTIHVTDCHDCDHAAKQKTKYTKYTFAEKMIELKAKGDTASSVEERANNYFLYANGIYNMTWYGNGRVIHETSVSYFSYENAEDGERPQGDNYFNCSEALAYYQKAFNLSKNKEFKAKCTWMSAKCEHNLWLDGDIATRVSQNADFQPGKYFNKMKTEYANTKYFQEAIAECGYFCTFITHSKQCIRDTLSLNQ